LFGARQDVGRDLVPRAYCSEHDLFEKPVSTLEDRALILTARHVTVGQRLHEGDDRVLLGIGQLEMAHRLHVHVVGLFRRRPAFGSLARVMRRTARQHVTRIVEIHDPFQALEIAIVSVGVYKARMRPLRHCAVVSKSRTENCNSNVIELTAMFNTLSILVRSVFADRQTLPEGEANGLMISQMLDL
jgi:hypothetical protein